MPDETPDPGGGGTIPACLGCDHQAPQNCEQCGGTQGTGGLPPCRYCLGRGNPPVSALGTWRGVQIEDEADPGRKTETDQ